MEKSNFALRLLPSLLAAAQRIAEQEDCSVNQFINVAVAEKIAVLDAGRWEQRAATARRTPRSKGLLDRLAGSEPPRDGDEVQPSRRKPKPAANGRHRADVVRQ